jgi:hypothetical protein
MENFDIVGLSLILFMALTAIGILIVSGYGLKNLIGGRHEWSKIVVVLFPFVVYGGLLAFFGDWTEAGIGTMIAMILAMVLLILGSGLRGTFK